MDTGFLATTIRRITRRKLFLYLFFLVGIFTSAGCMLLFFWLVGLKEPVVYITITTGALLICGVIVRTIFICIRNIQKPFESFYFNDFKSTGSLVQTIAQIDEESASCVGTKGAFATKHWVISAQSNSLTLFRLEDVVWIYKQVTVSNGRFYAARIWNRFGFCMTVHSSEDGINRLLGSIEQNAPWVTKGHMEYLAAAWERNRSAFIQEVDQRRKRILFHGDDVALSVTDKSAVKFPFEYDLNHPLVQNGIEEARKKQNFNVRAKGLLLLFAGLIGSMMCIVIPVVDMLNRESKIPISREGILFSLMFLIIGLYNAAFGSKGREFYEKTIGKSNGLFILSCILFGVTVLALFFGIDIVVKFFGYEVTSSLFP